MEASYQRRQPLHELAAATAMPSIPKELIDQFVTGPMSAEAVNAASMAFKKALSKSLRAQNRPICRNATAS